jgi:peptidoglycan/LPS O-acetylase OafA/YrhL
VSEAASPVAPRAQSRQHRHEPGLDGLRGLALAGVLAFHGGFSWAVGGFLGVSTFFTLSGFLITSLLLAEHGATGRIDLRRFWSRRFRRLLPAALVALGGVVVFGVTVATNDQVRDLRGDVLSALGYAANWRFVLAGRSYGDLFTSPSPVQHFWSLAIEEQFYVAFPLLVAAVLAAGGRAAGRRVLAVVLAVLVAASVAATVVLHTPAVDTARVYYGTDTRAAELLAGALLAVWWTRTSHRADRTSRRARRATVAVAAGGVVALAATVALWSTVAQPSSWLYEGGLAAVAACTVTLVVAAMSPGPVRWLLSRRALRWLGRVSYGAYLYHWPVFLWLSPHRTGWPTAPLFAVRVVVTFALAVASYHLVEQPVRAGRRITAWRPLVAAPAAALAVAVAVLATTAQPPPPTFEFASGPVVAPVAIAPTRIMVVGDSVVRARQRPRSVGPVDGQSDGVEHGHPRLRHRTGRHHHAAERPGAPSTPGCDSWATRWTEQLAEFDPDVVVVHSATWDMVRRQRAEWNGFESTGHPAYDRFLVREYEAAADVLSSSGAEVVWLVPPCVHRPDGPQSGVFAPGRVEHVAHDLLPALFADRPAVHPADLYAEACPGGRFTDVVGGVADARPDGVHFTPAAADRLAEWLGPLAAGLA